MKPWSYYSTPTKHPWREYGDIEKFKTDHPGVSKFVIAQWMWQQDELTRGELWALEGEFALDLCEDLGITPDQYHDLDPYDAIIGCPENHEFPSPSEFERMFAYVLERIGPKLTGKKKPD